MAPTLSHTYLPAVPQAGLSLAELGGAVATETFVSARFLRPCVTRERDIPISCSLPYCLSPAAIARRILEKGTERTDGLSDVRWSVNAAIRKKTRRHRVYVCMLGVEYAYMLSMYMCWVWMYMYEREKEALSCESRHRPRSVSTQSLTHASCTHTRANLYLIMGETYRGWLPLCSPLAPKDLTMTTTPIHIRYVCISQLTLYILSLVIFSFLERRGFSRGRWSSRRGAPRDVDSYSSGSRFIDWAIMLEQYTS